MTAASEEQKDDKKAYWQSELKSLGIESRRRRVIKAKVIG
jgi:hypothetical protein